jgi:hypothetical protein
MLFENSNRGAESRILGLPTLRNRAKMSQVQIFEGFASKSLRLKTLRSTDFVKSRFQRPYKKRGMGVPPSKK